MRCELVQITDPPQQPPHASDSHARRMPPWIRVGCAGALPARLRLFRSGAATVCEARCPNLWGVGTAAHTFMILGTPLRARAARARWLGRPWSRLVEPRRVASDQLWDSGAVVTSVTATGAGRRDGGVCRASGDRAVRKTAIEVLIQDFRGSNPL
jgi:lipoate synthase